MSMAGSWMVRLCRGDVRSGRTAGVVTAMGATVRWCGPDCTCGTDDGQGKGVSVFDDGTDLTDVPVAYGDDHTVTGTAHARKTGKGLEVTTVFQDPLPPVPAEETRGGENPDWDAARPGEPLPEKPPAQGGTGHVS